MSTVIERAPAMASEEQSPIASLFTVWFDTNCGLGAPDWWWEKPGAQPLPPALALAAQIRAAGWICKVVPAEMNPRPDGRWDNPA